jgi:pyrroloquinoline-quinone synthase
LEVVVIGEKFVEQLDSTIAQYDLLAHPFYKAWSHGVLTRDDLREYAQDYYHHVKEFPVYLARLAARLEDGNLRSAVLANMADEMGIGTSSSEVSRAHSALWKDFAIGMGSPDNLDEYRPTSEIKDLIEFFNRVASDGRPEEALASFYAYESQVPRVAKEKSRGLREAYGADARTCRYFTLHETADVYHAKVWRSLLQIEIEARPESADRALDAAETTAAALWRTLDGMEIRRGLRATTLN